MKYGGSIKKSPVYSNIDNLGKILSTKFEQNLVSFSIFGDDAIANLLFDIRPGLLLIFEKLDLEDIKFLDQLKIKQKYLNDFPVLIFTLKEFVNLEKDMPLELLHIKYNKFTIYGTDVSNFIYVKKIYVKNQIIRELQSVLLILRNAMLYTNNNDKVLIMQQVMSRLFITFKGIHFLRNGGKYNDWSWLITSIESYYNLSNMTLSEIISLQEKKDYAKLPIFLAKFIIILSELSEKVTMLEVDE